MNGLRRLVILVGTDHHPFDRAVTWADAHQQRFPEDDVLIQYGLSAPPTTARGVAFLSPVELRKAVAEADVVITHGGPGTISDARWGGHRPIVFPRDPALGEHVDDHQMRFAPWCAARGPVLLARTPEDLDAQLAALPETGTRLETRVDAAESAAARTFTALMSQQVSGREPVVLPGAPRVLHLVGDDERARQAEERLAIRPGVLHLGALVTKWPAGAAGEISCACGSSYTDCPFWGEVGKAAFGGWDHVDLRRVDELARTVPGTTSSRAARRHPGREARRRLLEYAGYHRAVLTAARDVAAAELLVMRGAPGVALALSHDRQLDLRVADYGAGLGPRWALRHRRVRLDRWPDPTGASFDDRAARLLGAWAPAAEQPLAPHQALPHASPSARPAVG